MKYIYCIVWGIGAIISLAGLMVGGFFIWVSAKLAGLIDSLPAKIAECGTSTREEKGIGMGNLEDRIRVVEGFLGLMVVLNLIELVIVLTLLFG